MEEMVLKRGHWKAKWKKNTQSADEEAPEYDRLSAPVYSEFRTVF